MLRNLVRLSILLPLIVTGCGNVVNIPKYDEMKNVSDAPPALQKAADAIVKIENSEGTGTGSFLSTDGLLLTNNHVLGIDEQACAAEGCFISIYRHYQIGFPYEAPVTVFAEPLRVSPELDAAMYQLWTDSTKTTKLPWSAALEISPRPAADLEGATIHLIGHPRSGLKKWTQGQVYDSHDNWFTTSNYSLPGNSGSPFLDADGKIVGILHRSNRDSSAISQHNALFYSIGSDGAGLAEFRASAPNISRFFSIKAQHSVAEIAAHQITYLMAHERNALGPENKPLTVVDALAQTCDLALAKTNYVSPEEVTAALGPCQAVLSWLNCVKGNDSDYKSCPSDTQATDWENRLKKAGEKLRSFNSENAMRWALHPWHLKRTRYEAASTSRALLRNYLAQAKPALNARTAYYLLDYDGKDAEYQGQKVVDYIKAFRSRANYEFDYSWTIFSYQSLYEYDVLTREEFGKEINAIFDDEKLDIGSKLDLEVIAYRNGLLR